MFKIYSVSRGNLVLWVGATMNIRARTKDHRATFGRNIKIEELEKCNSVEEATKREKHWIKKLKPRDNKLRSGGPLHIHAKGKKKRIRRIGKRCAAKRVDTRRCQRKALENSNRCSLHSVAGRIKGRNKKNSVNISLSASGRARLTMLATELGVSRSELIEQWIEGAPWPDNQINDG